ncbi:MAG: phenylalanine--tRNA ligase subunit beta, partial [Chlamydiia bacterium]|nr:phenylalanine--tRNA ligase subunit beta [Chlamydiia bacterium]
EWYLKKPTFQKVENRLKVTTQNTAGDLAARVMMVPMNGIKIGPSPLWMQADLTKVGIKPINNIVDITNYVMYLTAQPMHAFDYDKLAKHSQQGVVMGPRMAKKNEKITLLGGKQVTLTEDDIVLATDKVAVDIAGVMGGEATEVDENTKSILLTCCSFDMYTVRRMTMRHGIFTDA